MKPILKIGAGVHQGEFTFGMEVDVGLLSLRAVTYAAQVGEVAGTADALTDRRFALQLKLLI